MGDHGGLLLGCQREAGRAAGRDWHGKRHAVRAAQLRGLAGLGIRDLSLAISNGHLKNKELKREFSRIVATHEPDDVQRRIDQYGHRLVPTEVARFGDLQLTVELLPLPPDKRAPR